MPADRDELGRNKRDRGKQCHYALSELLFITHSFSASLVLFLREVPLPNETIKA